MSPLYRCIEDEASTLKIFKANKLDPFLQNLFHLVGILTRRARNDGPEEFVHHVLPSSDCANIKLQASATQLFFSVILEISSDSVCPLLFHPSFKSSNGVP
jgi:hypothetical protein